MIDWDPRVNEIFLKAIEAGSPDERAAALDELCRDAADLRGKVEALLKAHDQLGSFLERPSVETADRTPGTGEAPTLGQEMSRHEGPTPSRAVESDTVTSWVDPAPEMTTPPRRTSTPNTEGPGSIIGPYKLLEQIGEGGMGAVYMAEQEKPVRRKVALKLIKPGMDSRQVIARFEAERQALAMMDHPNIAKVLEAGTTESGRPYFVMELVKGVPLTQFCDERHLSPRQRLELMIPVCQAVQHAHQKGVIHRDLKPSNVLVALYDDEPVPKVIDFGVAKAIGPALTDSTLHTGFGAIVGTLAYMSPEQAQLNQLDVDTRSDVYSLGVLIYELLTGSTPIDRKQLGRAALLEALRVIREDEPPKPSTRLSTTEELASIAANRGIEPRKLSGLVRGDLDWIVMKALEKDRDRRYETASALALDVRRFLDDVEVEATPPSAGYRLRKFARRYRRGLTAAGAVAAILVVATGVSTWQAIRATRAERKAVESAEVSRELGDFLLNDLLGVANLDNQVNAGIAPNPDLKVRTLVDRAAGRLAGRFPDHPIVEAAVRSTIGNVYRSLGLPALARPLQERAYELRLASLGETNPMTLLTQNSLSIIETDLGLYERSESRSRRTLALATRRHGDESDLAEEIRQNLAVCLMGSGRLVEAESILRGYLGRDRGTTAHAKNRRLNAQVNLASVLLGRGRPSEAETLLEDGLRDLRKLPGDLQPLTPRLLTILATSYAVRGRFAEADGKIREALELSRGLEGDRHPITLKIRAFLGDILQEWGKPDQAEAVLRPLLAAVRDANGEGSEAATRVAISLAGTLRSRQRWTEAEALLRQALEPARRVGPHMEGQVDWALGRLHSDMGRYPEAEPELKRAEGEMSRAGAGHFSALAEVKVTLAALYGFTGRSTQAVDTLRDALSICEAHLEGDQTTNLTVLSQLASACRVAGKLDEAEALFPRAIAMARRLYGTDHSVVFEIQASNASLLHVRGRFGPAEAQYRECLDGFRRIHGPDDFNSLAMLSNLGELYRDWGRHEQAEVTLKGALEACRRSLGPDNYLTVYNLWKIGEMDRDRGRFPEAEAKLLQSLASFAKVQPPGSLDLAAMRADLGLTHLKAGAPEKAEPLLRQAQDVYDKELPEGWRRFEVRSQLGDALAGQKRYAEAEPLLIGGYEGLIARRKDVTVDAWPRLQDPGRRVIRLYESWGKPEKAAEWRKRIGSGPGGG